MEVSRRTFIKTTIVGAAGFFCFRVQTPLPAFLTAQTQGLKIEAHDRDT